MKQKNMLFFVCMIVLYLVTINNTLAQTYCTPINPSNNNNFLISNFSLLEIDNSSDKSANIFTFYNATTVNVAKGSTYTASITFEMNNYNEASVKVWLDFNNDGDFYDAGEEVYTYTGSEPKSKDGITKTFQIAIPNSANAATTRIRTAIRRGNTIDPCDLAYQVGEVEDYAVNIKPTPTPPTANCVSSININLDVTGNATINASDVNNGSFDDYDSQASLLLSIDKNSFNCDDVNNPATVNLTVTDTDGLSSTCATTVNVSAYNGAFTSPDLEDINAFCSYTAEAPVMNYQCSQQLLGTTTDTTSFTTAGNYTINWTFDNGTSTATSSQNITIANPSTPTSLNATNINETSATLNWTSSSTGTFRIQYRRNGTTTWTETTSTSTSKIITGLDDGLEYQYQVKVDASCATYSAIHTFTTIQVQYCDDNVFINKSNKYFISDVNIGNINNSTPKNDAVYRYFNTLSANVVIGETFSGTITYTRSNYNTTALVVWIDFNNDGDFDDSGEQILSDLKSGSASTVFTIALTNILVPETATLGKTRLRIGLKHTGTPTSACNFDYQSGEIEDYDIFLNAPDNTLFEAALISQVYHFGTSEKWIEVTNTSATDTVVANTLALALFKNSSGDQTGVFPTASLFINAATAPGASILIRNPSSTITNFVGTAIDNSAITDFDDANDILIITKKTDNTAWKNRFDLVESIPNNTCLLRSDIVTTYKNTYNSSEWISYVNDALSTTTNPPERHPHAPLISEIINGNAEANTKLGLHRIHKTVRSGNAWSNGYPDRSRSILIQEDFSTSSILKARKLEVANAAKLLVNNEPLVVSDTIKINTTGEIRLAGTSQLIQTHTGSRKVTGTGKLYVDQNSPVPSLYRYNYMSSPVVTPGLSTYTMFNVMKDGTTPTSLSSVPKNMNFIGGNDGNYSNSPSGAIAIAERWIYTYDYNGSNYDYIQKTSTGTINPGKGYLFKGPGRPQNYTYVGSPNDGAYSYTIAGSKSILLGNPYASALNSKKFIEDNLDATTGTLYFWEHAGETNSSGAYGHYSSSYIGGYATRNVSMGVAASNVGSNASSSTSYDYTMEAENAVTGGNASKINNSVLLTQPYDSITFNSVNISKSVDTLKVIYKSEANSTFDIVVNQAFVKSYTFTTSAAYQTVKIPLQIQKNDTLLLKTTSNASINIDNIFFTLAFEYTAPKQYIPIGQGFFASSDSDGGTIIFNNSQREFIKEGENAVFLKSGITKKINNSKTNDPLAILKLGFNYKNSEDQSLHRQIGISFSENNSFSYDKGYDSEMYDLNETDFYWQFDEIPNMKFVITGVQKINNDLEVPIHFSIDNPDELSVVIDEIENIDFPIFILDKLTNTYHNLSSTVELTLDKGVYVDRFYLAFEEKSLSVDDEIAKIGLSIYIDNSNKELVVKNNNNLEIAHVKIYNLLEQEVLESKNLEQTHENRINISNLSSTIYIVNLKTSEGVISKKILKK
ncbi:GEVED domain-containing protein [uncultured Polaribacter sp.]|uniref:GEVED domain-containing protein n=1 Tax=uncultured Polaribacter sp. TaxID=174711 RepID=UPI00262FB7EA|nr:GEVED domain-containing protein [uncultured Polaribacter sp.]